MRAPLLVIALITLPIPARAQPLEVVELPSGDRIEASVTSDAEAAMVAVSMPLTLDRVPAAERPGLPRAIAGAYRRMHDRLGRQPSVWTRSVQGDGPALLSPQPGDMAVIFLHGYGGNFVWPCALVAEAAARVGASTICPSLDAEAHWGERRGRRIVEDAIAVLRARGARRIILAGLSSGGVGASRLANRLRRELVGLVLLSGVGRFGTTRLPTLLIHGDSDRMVRPGRARGFARRSPNATLETLHGGHFVLAERPDDVVRRLARWLQDRRADPSVRPSVR